jgi:serralysin
MSAAGYVFSGSWSWAENIGWSGTTGPLNEEVHLRTVIEGLFHSPGHRRNTLAEHLEETGIGVLTGIMDGYNAVMVTEKFASSGSTPTPMLLGVAYNDLNENGVYDLGEGVEGVTVLPDKGQYYAVTSASGGFAIPVQGLSGTLTLNVSGGGLPGARGARGGVDRGKYQGGF